MPNLWRHADFLKLWAAQAISSFGARITREGIPLAAILTLDATPAQLGLLAALSRGPGLIVGIFGGGWVDSARRRPILIGADLFRAALLMTVPLAAWTHWLTMPQLYGVAALIGAASVLFDIADHAYLPSLIGKPDLLEGNAKLAVTESTAEIGGPALAGVLFQIFTPPIAILVDAATYVVSALSLGTIRQVEPPPIPRQRDQHWLADLKFGFEAVMAQPLIRPMLIMTVVQTFFGSFFASLYMLFGIKTLGLSTSLMGVTIAVGGVGALSGALLARMSVARLGPGPAILVMGTISAVSAVLIPLAPASVLGGTIVLMIGQWFGDAFAVAAMVPASTLRQTVFPREALGRTGAVFHVATGAMAVVGAIVGGVAAEHFGIRPTMWVGALGIIAGQMILIFSPLRKLRKMPE
ncbi:putative MFS family arabinose efflux permease [Caulobacter ginsengisoli]|uniref:MFS family arabinose efflux permease n=1 Tax=Caulobacter ginsengisoli TaxID=400775 RepID=A0ABU0IMB1_9CAUL|nr:MFS transporter [Caulobacter ginsengisoli]MDQ0463163.1 putative MFS family arabinose efflux permease [Caulobacter ginsengisoli]